MRTIWKFEAPVADDIEILMPYYAAIMKAGSQKPQSLCFWAMVETDAPKQKRLFKVRGTGPAQL